MSQHEDTLFKGNSMSYKSHILILLSIFTGGCIELAEDSCSEYVNYMCNCHSDDPNYNCSELKVTYENPDASTQEQCALDLDDQIYEDEQEGLSCDLNDTGLDSGI